MTDAVPAKIIERAHPEWRRLRPLLPEDAGEREIALLESYCAAFARWREAEDKLSKSSPLVKGERGGVRQNPYIAVATEAKRTMRDSLAELGLGGATADDDGWCSLEDARRRLADRGDVVSNQALSLYLKTYPEIPRRTGRGRAGMRVDFDALASHRAESIRVQDRAGPSAEEAAADIRLRERRALAGLREFQLAERKGELITRTEVLRAVHGAAVSLTQLLQRTRYERAEALEGASGARAKAALLLEQDEAAQRAFSDALAALAGGQTGDDGDTGDDAGAGDDADSAEAA